jgi:hypothetical protein
MRRIGVGVYVDDERGEIHINIPELLDAANWDDTPENREKMMAIARKCATEAMPGVPQTVVGKRDRRR